ncbi:MAG: CoA-binding protein, partial [Hyphomicrobiales bacterium]|nr:CoA-binding protein [Hyphomicrobiales bacterium]
EAVVDGLVALGRIAVDLGDSLQSIDINPFVVMPKGQGATALDALVVLRG